MDSREEFSKALSSLVGEDVDVDFKQGFEKDGIENSLIMGVVMASKLDCIANALEEIARKMDYLEELPEELACIKNCIGYIPPSRFSPPGTPGCNYIRIGGTVDTD